MNAVAIATPKVLDIILVTYEQAINFPIEGKQHHE